MDVREVRRLWSACRAGLRGLRASPLIFLLSVGTLSAGLLLLGTYLLVLQNMRDVLERFGSDVSVVAFLEPSAAEDPAVREVLRVRVEAMEGVRSVRYVSPEQALERLRYDLGDEASLLEGLEGNPLPASLEIELQPERRTPDEVRALAERLDSAREIEEVRYGEAWIESYSRILRAVEGLGVALGAFLVLVLGTIVAGTVRLAFVARADEIQIQRLVGAGALFVRLPFYLEGALQGAVAALLALAVLYGLYGLGLPLVGELLSFVLGRSSLSFFGWAEMGLLVGLGVGLGVGGAVLSLLRLEESA
ncbi:MAG: cell division protein FtsX [Myxococcota bacterium]